MTNVMDAKAVKVFKKLDHTIQKEDLTKYMVMIDRIAETKDLWGLKKSQRHF